MQHMHSKSFSMFQTNLYLKLFLKFDLKLAIYIYVANLSILNLLVIIKMHVDIL